MVGPIRRVRKDGLLCGGPICGGLQAKKYGFNRNIPYQNSSGIC